MQVKLASENKHFCTLVKTGGSQSSPLFEWCQISRFLWKCPHFKIQAAKHCIGQRNMSETELVPGTTSLWLSDLADKMELRKRKEPVHSGWSKQRHWLQEPRAEPERRKRKEQESQCQVWNGKGCQPFHGPPVELCSSVTTTQTPPPLWSLSWWRQRKDVFPSPSFHVFVVHLPLPHRGPPVGKAVFSLIVFSRPGLVK